MTDAKQVAENYMAAFREANGYEIECLYERGWFLIRYLNSTHKTRLRRAALLGYIDRLRAMKSAPADYRTS